MKLADLKEMAVRGGDLRNVADVFAKQFHIDYPKIKHNFKHIGDIDNLAVYSNSSYYLLLEDEKIVLICKTENIQNYGTMIDDVWVDSTLSGKGLFSKILWFLYSRQNLHPLYFGAVHSDETYELLKRGGFSKFKKTWVNDYLNAEEPFDKDNLDKYYTSSKWKLKLEATDELKELKEEVSQFRFLIDGYTKCAYDWQIEQI